MREPPATWGITAEAEEEAAAGATAGVSPAAGAKTAASRAPPSQAVAEASMVGFAAPWPPTAAPCTHRNVPIAPLRRRTPSRSAAARTACAGRIGRVAGARGSRGAAEAPARGAEMTSFLAPRVG